jgi:hypothetical protein
MNIDANAITSVSRDCRSWEPVGYVLAREFGSRGLIR